MSKVDNVPVIVQDWAREMVSPQNSPAIRYNYFMQFKNLAAFAAKQIELYEKTSLHPQKKAVKA